MKVVNKRHTSPFWNISLALKYMLKGEMTCGSYWHEEQCMALSIYTGMIDLAFRGNFGTVLGDYLERTTSRGQKGEGDVGPCDRWQLQQDNFRSNSIHLCFSKPCFVYHLFVPVLYCLS